MAINIKFNLAGNPEPPTIILANRNGNKLGQLDVDSNSIELNNVLNGASEFSFTLNKYIDNKITNLWDKVVDFKLVYCKEWDMWFEISVEIDEKTETTKTVTCTQLGHAELSQIMLYNIEINTEDDIARDDYKISILYDESDPKSSILNRMLEKAPHYSIAHVDPTIAKIQRSFSFDGNSIDDGFQEIAEEIGCLFQYPSNSSKDRNICRDIFVYDLQQNCNDCGHRGEFTDKCPECGSENIKYGYGKDTLIFVTSDELASDGIQLKTDTDSVKNCFKLEAGDDLMTATVRNCNPNGTDYIWNFSDDIKEDMSDELVKKLEAYNKEYKYYCDRHSCEELISKDKQRTFIIGKEIMVGDDVEFKCLSKNSIYASVSYSLSDNTFGIIGFGNDMIPKYVTASLHITDDIKSITVNEYVEVYLTPRFSKYNDLVDKYKTYNENLQKISTPIIGYSSLMNAYYNVIDLSLYLESGLMPSVEISETNAVEQANLLTVSSLSPVAVADVTVASLSTVNSAVLAMAKTIVKSTYKVQVNTSEIVDSGNARYWEGNFSIVNYSDEEDNAISNTITVAVNDDLETFIKQKIEKALNKENEEDLSISGLFEKEYDDFCEELKKYALNPLTSFYDACRACIDILIEQGVGNNDTWSNTDEGSDGNLYKNLYLPYYDKLMAIEAEIKIREDEIGIISGVYDTDGNLVYKGLQQNIENCITIIQDALDFEKYLGDELWIEFCAYRREDKYSNENYISDGLNNAELFNKALEFFEVANNEIHKSSELQHSISTTLNNLLKIPKFKPLIKSFELGNWIRVQIDDKIYKLRLLKYDISYSDFNNINVDFSDVVRIKNGITDVKDILSQASSMATSYSSVKRQASQGKKSNVVLNNWIENGLNATQTKIVNAADESQLWSKDGFWCRQYDPITGTYSDEQIKIINSTIAITDDNWNTTKTAIGKYYYKDPITGEQKIAYGVNGETIVGQFILGENMSMRNESGTMVFDGNGLSITSGTDDDVGTMTFNEDGLIVSHGKNTVTISPKSEEVMNITNGEDKVFEIDENGELSINGNIIARSLRLESGVKIDSGVITNLSTVATSGSYDDLLDAPTKLSDFDNDVGFINNSVNNLTNYYTKTNVNNLLNSKANSSDLANVATSGDYNDLSNTPILSTVATSGSYNDLIDIEELKNWVLEQIQLAMS